MVLSRELLEVVVSSGLRAGGTRGGIEPGALLALLLALAIFAVIHNYELDLTISPLVQYGHTLRCASPNVVIRPLFTPER